MALSESEQRMLKEIETSLYADDPSFASSVSQASAPHNNRVKLRLLALAAIGAAIMIVGIFIPLQGFLGGFPIISLLGVLMVFFAGISLIRGSHSKKAGGSFTQNKKNSSKLSHKRSHGGFSSRMEDRFNGRFE